MMTKELSCGTLTVEDRADSEYDSHTKTLQLRFWETDADNPTVVRLAMPPVGEAAE